MCGSAGLPASGQGNSSTPTRMNGRGGVRVGSFSPSDKARLLEKGVSAVFGAGTSSDDIVATVRKLAVASAN